MEKIDYERIEELVRGAGKIMLKADFSGEIVHEKHGEANFCTDYDVEIQKFLIAHLSQLVPGAAFYGDQTMSKKYPGKILQRLVIEKQHPRTMS